MAVSTRELYLILRARDEASRILNGVSRNVQNMGGASQKAAQRHIAQGQALMTMGTAFAFAGAAGLNFFNETAKAATTYENEARKALTQTDNIGAKLEDLKAIGRDVASAIPAPFEQMQGALYDIFSSMDVNVTQAKRLLIEFSKASVAGQVDLQTAAKGTITILNAWRMPATKVNEVNDVMFQLVRKGVGTYDDFSRAIGRAIPSTVRAGGSIQDLAGMMAFMTRNGLSTAQAATSAARAFDAMSHPKTAQHMKEIGVSVRDAKGEFRPMVDIMGDLNAKLGQMSAPQRAKVLYELFKGSGGTIQARRFFDLAIPGFKELKQRTDDMINSQGAMQGAYNIMLKSPQSQLQLLQNRWEALRTEIGDKVLPIKMKLVQVVSELMNRFNELSPRMKTIIIYGTMLAAALTVVIGVVAAVAGAMLMVSGAMALAGTSLGAIAAAAAPVIVAIAAIGVVIFLLIKYWDQVKAAGMAMWAVLQPIFQGIWDFLMRIVQAVVSQLWPAFQTAWTQILNIVSMVQQKFQTFLNWLLPTWTAISVAFQNSWIAATLGYIARVVLDVVVAAFAIFANVLGIVVNVIVGVFGPAMSFIIDVITNMVKIVTGIIQIFLGVLTGNWKMAWDGVKNIFSGIWNIIISLLGNFVKAVLNIIMSFVEGFVRFFRWLMDVLVGHSIVPDMVNAIVRWILQLPGRILGAIGSLVRSFAQVFVRMWTAAGSAISSGASKAIAFIKGIPGRIKSAFGNPGGILLGIGRSIMDGLMSGIRWGIDKVKGLLNSVTGMIPDWKGPAKVDKALLTPNGRMIMKSIIPGFQKELPNVKKYLQKATSDMQVGGYVSTDPVVPFGGGRPRGGPGDGPGVTQNFYITTQEIDPRKHSADLGWLVANDLSTSR